RGLRRLHGTPDRLRGSPDAPSLAGRLAGPRHVELRRGHRRGSLRRGPAGPAPRPAASGRGASPRPEHLPLAAADHTAHAGPSAGPDIGDPQLRPRPQRVLLRHRAQHRYSSIGAGPAARRPVRARKVGGSTVVRAVHSREVPLQSVSRRLKAVVAVVPESTLVGAAGTRAAVLGTLPEATSTADEVHAFVEMLMEHDDIAFEGAAPAARRAAAGRGRTRELPTHAIRLMGRKKVLSRLRFASCAG